ncbi:MAG: Histidine ammonia-lyase [Ignavibacteriaceae bacterium]|nr:Histidine ammonia-lyase [Ignavibacteriaceae bacterium]
MADKQIQLDGNSLSLSDIENLLKKNLHAVLTPKALSKMKKSRALIDKWMKEDKVIYGVTTGFGEFSNVKISPDKIKELQRNLIFSHSAGTGKPLPPKIVKIMMLLRVNALAKGHSGIRPETAEAMLAMMNSGIIPVVPSQGSVGSSGDLVQLSHLVLSLLGEGTAYLINEPLYTFQKHTKPAPSKKYLKSAGITPVILDAKEGLALINGTQMMTSFGAYISIRAQKLKKVADIAAALSHEALRGTDRAYDERIHNLRPYKGQKDTARNMLFLIQDSEIRSSHLTGDTRVQDAYSLRCVPQIHGASRDAIDYVSNIITTEINSANDNPLIFADESDHLEGGNFHGQPVALAMDYMAIALSEFANVSERRIERMVNGALSFGLPRFLTKDGGLNSGMMIAQYTAASLVSENKVLAHPASVDSIPTSANQEDHNSMGSIAAQKCYKILKNLENVLTIEILTACQAIDFLKPLSCGKGTGAAYNFIRERIPHLDKDRILHDDIAKALQYIKDDSLLASVESVVTLQ